MNKKHLIAAISLLLYFGLVGFAPAAHDFVPEVLYPGQAAPSDEELKSLAVSKGIISPDTDINEEIKQKNTTITWLLLGREDKIKLIEELKAIFKRHDVTIRFGAEYYVDELNGALYNSIKKGDIDKSVKKGFRAMFTTVAMMDGDFESLNGKTRLEELKEQLGDKMFEEFKKRWPDKYKHLLKLDRQGRKLRK